MLSNFFNQQLICRARRSQSGHHHPIFGVQLNEHEKKQKNRENVVCVCERRRRTVGRRDAETRQTEESYGSRLSAPDDGRRPGDVFAFAFSYPGSSPPPCPKRKEGRGGSVLYVSVLSLVCVVYVSAIASHTTTKKPKPK